MELGKKFISIIPFYTLFLILHLKNKSIIVIVRLFSYLFSIYQNYEYSKDILYQQRLKE